MLEQKISSQMRHYCHLQVPKLPIILDTNLDNRGITLDDVALTDKHFDTAIKCTFGYKPYKVRCINGEVEFALSERFPNKVSALSALHPYLVNGELRSGSRRAT